MLRTSERGGPGITTRVTFETIGPTLNISAGGMCVLSEQSVPEGINVVLKFDIPTNMDFVGDLARGCRVAQIFAAHMPTLTITCNAEVIRCVPSDAKEGAFEIGLNFTRISDEDRSRISEFVDANLPPAEPAPTPARAAPDPGRGNR